MTATEGGPVGRQPHVGLGCQGVCVDVLTMEDDRTFPAGLKARITNAANVVDFGRR